MRNKLSYAEEVRNSLYLNHINRDVTLDFREIIIQLDHLVNQSARLGFLDNWKNFATGKVDDLWITEFTSLIPTDPTNGNSYCGLPTSNYVVLPKGQGLNAVFFMNNPSDVKKKYFYPIIIVNYNDFAGFRSSMANNNQGRISCCVKDGLVLFDRPNIFKVYGQVGMRIVLRDASALADTDPYPIPADYENTIISQCIDFFSKKFFRTPDLIRDNNDKKE